ncbi:DUF4352 domain-containing protein [Nocardiopsis sp. NPDC007018]|uniref:DUF4352 domain-containing protein n=1 Tax=Nocardiopsis sp. NPDC007018 TaxID=3155721 RepID=UPI0033EA5750
MTQPPPHGQDPYQGPPYGSSTGGQPPMGPSTGGQPPMGPPPGGMPPGGMPPMGPPPGGMPPGGMPPGGMPGGPPPMGPPPGGMPPGGPGGPYGGDPYGPGPGPEFGGDPYGGQYGPPTPPPSKGSGPWLWISLGCGGLFVIGVALVVLLVFFFADNEGGGDGGGGTTGGTEETEGTDGTDGSGGSTGGDTSTGLGNAERSNPDLPGMGEEVEHNGMLFTVTEVETGVTEVGSFTPYGEYVVVWVEVAPAGSDPITFWRDEQNLYTYDGTAIGEDYAATLEFSSEMMNVSIDPGDSLVVPIVFDVDDASDISYMGLSAETFGGSEVEVDVTG